MRGQGKSMSASSNALRLGSRRLVFYVGGVIFFLVVAAAILLDKGKWFSQKVGETHSFHEHGDNNSTRKTLADSSLVSTNSTPAPGLAPVGMIWIPGGTFWMGCEDCEMPDTAPVHLVNTDGFWIDTTPVTNAQFALFAEATGYATIAERKPDPKDYPGVDPESLVA